MRLNAFDNAGFDRGAARWKEALWLGVSGLLVASWLPGSSWRVAVLRFFGTRLGQGVVVKPGVRVKFPWRLTVGDYCWLGEDVWIDNLAPVTLGRHVCLSQGAYLCTGSHDWAKTAFDLIVKPIVIGDHAWLCAFSRVAPGTVVEEGAVLGFASVGGKVLQGWTVYSGNPAVPVKKRTVAEKHGES